MLGLLLNSWQVKENVQWYGLQHAVNNNRSFKLFSPWHELNTNMYYTYVLKRLKASLNV